MDFRLYGRVLWRFRLVIAIGLLLALVLAFLSVVRVGSHGITYRDARLWDAKMKLQVTQQGCPECRLYASRATGGKDATAEPVSPKAPVVDPNRFPSLAIQYSTILTSDPVRKLAARRDGITGKIIATPLRDDQSGVLLPYIDVESIAESAPDAVKYAERTAGALSAYILREQLANGVAPDDRVVVQTSVHPHGANVFRPRSKTLPIVVFLAVMFATVSLAFILENMRPRLRELDSGNAAQPNAARDAERRRSA
jgi:hypothetical protein